MALPEKPITRIEKYLSKIAGEEAMLPENAITRAELYLAKIAGQEVKTPAYPVTRFEQYLDYIAENGGGGSSGGLCWYLSKNDAQVLNRAYIPTSKTISSATAQNNVLYWDVSDIFTDANGVYMVLGTSASNFSLGMIFVDSVEIGKGSSYRVGFSTAYDRISKIVGFSSENHFLAIGNSSTTAGSDGISVIDGIIIVKIP